MRIHAERDNDHTETIQTEKRNQNEDKFHKQQDLLIYSIYCVFDFINIINIIYKVQLILLSARIPRPN